MFIILRILRWGDYPELCRKVQYNLKGLYKGKREVIESVKEDVMVEVEVGVTLDHKPRNAGKRY